MKHTSTSQRIIFNHIITASISSQNQTLSDFEWLSDYYAICALCNWSDCAWILSIATHVSSPQLKFLLGYFSPCRAFGDLLNILLFLFRGCLFIYKMIELGFLDWACMCLLVFLFVYLYSVLLELCVNVGHCI